MKKRIVGIHICMLLTTTAIFNFRTMNWTKTQHLLAFDRATQTLFTETSKEAA